MEPAIWDHSPSSPSLTVSSCLLLQSNPANPDITDFALLSTGAKTVVESSAVVGYNDGISISGAGGTLAVSGSTVVTPAPTSFLGSLAPIASVYADHDPASVRDSTLVGRTGLFDQNTDASITRTVVRASGAGVLLRDAGDAPTLTARDSVIEPAAGGTLYTGVAVSSSSISEAEVPVVSLIFDSVLARSDSTAPSSGPPHALDVSSAATGTHVSTRNTIMRALDTSGAGANDDIVTGSHAINWDLGHTDYTQTAGPGVPPPGSGTNIDALPFYKGVDDLRLASNSSLFDAGDASVVQAGETDVTGAPRAVAHACGAPALPDLGAFEASSPSCPPPTVGPPPAVGSPVPALGQIHASHKTWREGSKLASVASVAHKHERKPPVGTTFTFTLNTQPRSRSPSRTASVAARSSTSASRPAQQTRSRLQADRHRGPVDAHRPRGHRQDPLPGPAVEAPPPRSQHLHAHDHREQHERTLEPAQNQVHDRPCLITRRPGGWDRERGHLRASPHG